MNFDIFLILFHVTAWTLFENASTGDLNGCNSANNCTNDIEEGTVKLHTLSRRKRFLVFPEGSSLQLVFCLQVSALIPIGDIFLVGSTLALAWALPKDPKFLYDFKSYKEIQKNGQRRGDIQKNIYYVDSDGKVIGKIPYKRKPIVNPVFAKRSIHKKESRIPEHVKQKAKIYRQKLHEMQAKREYLKMEHMDDDSLKFHRSSRIDLLTKLETVFTGLGYDGRQCILRKLCDMGNPDNRQRSFLHEILRTVFTLPKEENTDDNFAQEYDEAHSANGECTALYSGCSELVF